MTKKTRLIYIVCAILSILLNVGPMATYAVLALLQGTLMYQKVALTMTVFVVLILTAVAIMNKCAMKSRLWVILIGIYLCLGYAMTPIIIIGCCQVADELIVSPLKLHFKNRYMINKEFDLRQ